MISLWEGKNVLVTGACGTIGAELIFQLSQLDCQSITGVDNSETELFFIGEKYKDNPNVEFYLCAVSYTHLTLPTNREV